MPPCPFSKEKPCCEKKTACWEYFSLTEAKAWRGDMLFHTDQTREQTREVLHAHRLSTTLPSGKTYCVKFMGWWTGWPVNMLYGRDRSNGKKCGPRSRKDIDVLAWFNLLKASLEMMPDRPVYQVNAPMKRDVINWYAEDVKTFPFLYSAVSASYFKKVWRDHMPESS